MLTIKATSRIKSALFPKYGVKRGIHCINAFKKTQRPVCANMDFYSGFIYEMIGIPSELYTPIFAMSRIVGWCAHRIKELNFEDRRIIRPAYLNVFGEREYVPMERRWKLIIFASQNRLGKHATELANL